MLTRIEIDGFKTFKGFSIDVPPFMVIVGRNASGKSNLFDAIHFLSLIASGTLVEAVSNMRGDLDELLHVPSSGNPTTSMSFAVEVLLDPYTRDDFGDEREVTHSRLRYEIELEVRSVITSRRSGSEGAPRRQRLFVKREAARLIRMNYDPWVRALGLTGKQRTNFAPYSNKSRETLLETSENDKGFPAFKVHQDGRSGSTKSLPAADAAASVLSTLTTMEYQHLFALKREMQSWRQLHLEPEAVRSPSSFDDEDRMSSNGGNLPNVLDRILDHSATEDQPEGLMPAINASLSRIIPEVTGVTLALDLNNRQRQIIVQTGSDAGFTALVASDGTVRTLALLTALYDPDEGSLICFEEPENGIYPQRLNDLVRQLRQLVWESLEARTKSRTSVAKQLLISSHSPVILRMITSRSRSHLGSETVFVDMVTAGNRESKSRITRSRRVVLQDQGELKIDPRDSATNAEVASFEVWSELG